MAHRRWLAASAVERLSSAQGTQVVTVPGDAAVRQHQVRADRGRRNAVDGAAAAPGGLLAPARHQLARAGPARGDERRAPVASTVQHLHRARAARALTVPERPCSPRRRARRRQDGRRPMLAAPPERLVGRLERSTSQLAALRGAQAWGSTPSAVSGVATVSPGFSDSPRRSSVDDNILPTASSPRPNLGSHAFRLAAICGRSI